MEGLLWKWTNYWSGWQPRWFILDSGILSYYNSQDEVAQGCKGSIKMSVCDVHVDHGDPCRLELVIAREQHFYLKAANEKERQQWLVALGSCKATLQAISEPRNYLSQKDQKLLSGVKQKESELRIYCDLLMQQVHAIKQANASTPIDTAKIDQCSQLLSETCDTFINTLEDCMKLVDKPSNSRHSSAREVTKPSSPVNPGMKHLHSPTHGKNPPRSILRNSGRSTSQSSTDTDLESTSVNAAHLTEVDKHKNGELVTQSVSKLDETPAGDVVVDSSSPTNQTSTPPAPAGLSNHTTVASNVPANFFNTMGSSFMSMVGSLDDGVNTKDFTASAAELAKLFDKLSSSAFSPIKNDLLGNVTKIKQKWTTDPRSLSTLQKLVAYEIDHGQHLDPNSATQALLWLTRGLLFVSNIVLEYPKRDSLYESVTLAYERTLKPFHNFVVRGVVSIGLRAMPYKSGFISCLAADPNIDPTDEYFIQTLYADGNRFQDAVSIVCKPVIEFYKQHNMIVVHES